MIRADFEQIFDQVVDSYQVRIPTYVLVSKKNKKAVNLNVYRNLHHHHLNTQKKNFADEVTPLLRDKPAAERVWIHYTIFAPSNRRLDTMNIGSIADKYFSDTMVEAGKLPDDNTEHLVLSTFSFGGLAKMDGHAIATVNILNKKEPEDMRILLDQEDIQNALNAYVKTLSLPNAENATVELSIEDEEIMAVVIMGEAPVKNKGGRPRKKPGPKPKATPKEEVADAVETDPEGSSDDSDSGSGDDATPDAEAGAKATDEAKAEKATTKGNLFGDEESPSSDSETSEAPKESGTSKVKTKKSSIFDVD